MTTILIPAVLAFIVPTLIYLAIAVRARSSVHTVNEYYIVPRSSTSRALYSSFMGTGTSIASAVLVFIFWSSNPQVGFAAIYSPLLWALGAVVMWRLYRYAWPYLRQFQTLHGFLEHNVGGARVRKMAALVTMTGFLGQVGVEIVVGATVLDLSAPDSSWVVPVFCAALVATVLSYSWFGGFLAVMRSEGFKYYITLSGLVLGATYLASINVGDYFGEVHLRAPNTKARGLP